MVSRILRPAPAAEIIEIVGPLEDSVLMRIVETGATPAEVFEAFTWANADDQIGTELEDRPRGAVVDAGLEFEFTESLLASCKSVIIATRGSQCSAKISADRTLVP
jgi:hypothetical protein